MVGSNISMIDEFWCKLVCLTDNTECDHLTSFSFANIQMEESRYSRRVYITWAHFSISPKIFIKSRLSSSFYMLQRARVLESFNDDVRLKQLEYGYVASTFWCYLLKSFEINTNLLQLIRRFVLRVFWDTYFENDCIFNGTY